MSKRRQVSNKKKDAADVPTGPDPGEQFAVLGDLIVVRMFYKCRKCGYENVGRFIIKKSLIDWFVIDHAKKCPDCGDKFNTLIKKPDEKHALTSYKRYRNIRQKESTTVRKEIDDMPEAVKKYFVKVETVEALTEGGEDDGSGDAE